MNLKLRYFSRRNLSPIKAFDAFRNRISTLIDEHAHKS